MVQENGEESKYGGKVRDRWYVGVSVELHIIQKHFGVTLCIT